MARVTLVPTNLTAPTATVGNDVLDPTGTASVVGAGNGFTIAYPGAKVLLLRVSNASGGSGTISVLGGAQPLAPSSGQGPTTVTVANSQTRWIGPFESARVSQSDGSISIESSVIMTVTAFTVDGRRSA